MTIIVIFWSTANRSIPIRLCSLTVVPSMSDDVLRPGCHVPARARPAAEDEPDERLAGVGGGE
ncbi:hypothetical protein CAE01nite_01030 [Cellulomonas aerilata]|uniref:Uncharacterized protein n=1 Tax=Cellulomonas aerilata TaxID=515326 RepID=A0A512D7B3_9CELL|nr:hypothetical protein CAE01nite_01030 [Cellulomonas aerilata]